MTKKILVALAFALGGCLLFFSFSWWKAPQLQQEAQQGGQQQPQQEQDKLDIKQVPTQEEHTASDVVPPANLPSPYCAHESFKQKNYIICRADPARDDIRLFLNDGQGKPYRHFSTVNATLSQQGKVLAFAMNAGMYHDDYRAVGLYVEGETESHPISTRDGPGNFHLKPNGVFFIADGKAGVLETQNYLAQDITPQFATQSGPMLVIDNQLHPRFIVNSPFLHYRNAVGVDKMGMVIFVISESRVNFDEMARLFRDRLQSPNALFLDGSISSLYAPEVHRFDWWHSLGPIIGVVVKK